MENLMLQANKRDVFGKKTRFLRRQGITPTHLFGHGLGSLSLQCDTAKLHRIIAQAGTTRLISLEIEGSRQPRNVLIREVQRDACSGALLHADFYQVRKTEKIKVDVPIVLIGEAPALKEKGRTLMHGVTSLSIECLPDKIPSQVEVDLSSLEELEQAVFVGDITLSPDVTVITDLEQMVVKVAEVYVEKVEEVPVEAEVEAVEVEAEVEEAETRPSKEPEQ